MKVRMLAVLSILSLAAWLPVQAQQAPTPSAQAAQTPVITKSADDTSKSAAKHECCCAAKSQASASHDSHSAACCAKSEKTDQASAQCCKEMKDGQCPVEDGKSCCESKNMKAGKECCAGMSGECPAHANGK